MTKNLFLTFTLRQPFRAFLLCALIGAAAFALTLRAVEFVVIEHEVARLESHYVSIGVLTPTHPYNITTTHDVTRALDIVEASRYVNFVDARRFTQGIMHEHANLASVLTSVETSYFNPDLYSLPLPVMDFYFYGHIIRQPIFMPGGGRPHFFTIVASEEVLVGDTSVVREGDQVFTNHLGQTTAIRSAYNVHLYITEEEVELYRAGLWDPFDSLELGERALFRISATVSQDFTLSDGYRGLWWHMRSVTGEDGLIMDPRYNPREFGGYFPRMMVQERDTESLRFYIKADDTLSIDATLASLADKFDIIRENNASFLVIESHDVSAIPRFADRRITSLMHSERFGESRWITAEDYGQAVAMLPAQMATRRGIQVGDIITLTLRDNPRPNWIDSPSFGPWVSGIENWWDVMPHGWWTMSDTETLHRENFPTYYVQLQVVGFYWFSPPFASNFTPLEIFVPAGVIPHGVGWDLVPQLTSMYSFVLNSPRHEEAFIRETRAALLAQGFTAQFMPNGFETLRAATDPILLSTRINFIMFSTAGVFIFAFVVFMYVNGWKKAVAIAQALGIPRRDVLVQLFRPVLVLWIPPVIVGGFVAWWFAMTETANTMQAIENIDSEIMLEWYWVVGFLLTQVILILFLLFYVGKRAAGRPVLEQIQGDTTRRPVKQEYVESGEVPEDFHVGNLNMKPLKRHTFARIAAFWRTRLRYLTRMPGRSFFLFFLPLVLLVSISWLYYTITTTETEIERLWNETIVQAEIVRDHETEAPLVGAMPYIIMPNTWRAIYSSEFVREVYIEAVWQSMPFETGGIQTIMGTTNVQGLIEGNTRILTDEQLGITCNDIAFHFFDGFGLEDFAWELGDEIFPMIVRQSMIEDGRINPDDTYTWGRYDDGEIYFVESQVIGYFTGGLLRGINRFGEDNYMMLVPFNFHLWLFSGGWPFEGWGTMNTGTPPLLTARFTIDSARNRELADLRELAADILPSNNNAFIGHIPLVLLLDDDVFIHVVAPMEQNLSLLRVLFPIAVIVSVALAISLALLAMLFNAKRAAVERVMGITKQSAIVSFCVEQLMPFGLGLILGVLLLFIVGAISTLSLFLALLLLAGSIIGSLVGAFIISLRSPLELLQVKE